MAKKNTKPNPSPLSHLKFVPHYLLLIILIISIFLAAYQTFMNPTGGFGSVLGKDDEDEDEDDDNSGEGNDEDENDDDDDNSGEDNDEDEDDHDSNEDSDDEDDSDTNNSGSSNKSKTRTIIKNDDGTTSEVRREFENGKEKIEIKTYDAAGNKIQVQKREVKDGEEEVKVKTYDAAGEKISDYRLKTEDGKELELRIKEGETEVSRVRYDAEKQELEVRNGESTDDTEDAIEEMDDGSRVRIRANGENFVIQRSGVDAATKFPIVVDGDTGQIYVTTPQGNVELKAMPDSIIEKASTQLSSIEDVSIDDSTVSDESLENQLVYTVTGTKAEKFLGVFTVNIPSQLIYDADTGTFIKGEATDSRILDFFSF